MKIQHNVGYAKNLGTERRNQNPYEMKTEKKKGKSGVPESPLGRGTVTMVTLGNVFSFTFKFLNYLNWTYIFPLQMQVSCLIDLAYIICNTLFKVIEES